MPAPAEPAFSLPADWLADAHRRAGAARWSVTEERLARAVGRSCRNRFGEAPVDPSALRRYLDALQVEDLALACGCRDGSHAAWEHFTREVLPQLRTFARGVHPSDGPLLADALVADLYVSDVRDGNRRSLLDYFHGRSRLTTWLRTVIAQRHVDALRQRRREVPLDAHRRGYAREPGSVEGPDRPAGAPEHPWRDPQDAQAHSADRARLLGLFEAELRRAIGALPAADRLRLCLYYVHGMTLARIAGTMREHESSASRRLERIRRQVRDEVERALKGTYRFTDVDLRQCYEETARYGSVEVTTLLELRDR